MRELDIFADVLPPAWEVLEKSLCHGTSPGFAVSYLGAAVREVHQVADGLLFKAGFGRTHKSTHLCVKPEIFNLPLSAERVICVQELALDKALFTKTTRKEYVLRSLDAVHALSSKHRYNETVAPLKAMATAGYKLLPATLDHLESILKLWKEWCAAKLADPRTHAITFTGARYKRCVEDALLAKYEARVFVLINEAAEVASCRVLNICGERAFDLAFFSSFSSAYAARAMQYLSLKSMFESGIKEVNFGESTSSRLTYFKMRFAPEILKIYQYDRKVVV